MRDIQGMDARARIAKVLDEKGLSTRGVSLAAGLSDSMLHKFLTKQTKSITVDNLEKVAGALGVSLRYLMFGDEEHENIVYYYDKLPQREQKRAVRLLKALGDDTGDGTNG